MRLFELIEEVSVRRILLDGRELDRADESVRDHGVTGIVTDSRRAKKGSLMVCISGLRRDANEYATEAIENGASVILTESADRVSSAATDGVILVETDNARESCSHLFDRWYGSPSKKMKYIAVTGTNGKTSVTYMLKRILEEASIKCGVIGTVKCFSLGREIGYDNPDPSAAMTTPDPEQLYSLLGRMASDGVEYVILEATSHALHFEKLSPIRFKIAVFTNLTPDHLDFHGDMEGYFLAKARLFEMCDTAIVNRDCHYGARLASMRLCNTLTCSLESESAELYAADILQRGIDGCSYRMVFGAISYPICCGIPGRFTVMNTLEASAAAMELGIAPSVIARALSGMSRIEGRMERILLPHNAPFSVIIDYAHTPDALENLLATVNGFKENGARTVLIFGCGGDRDRLKRPLMGGIAERLADFTVVTSDNCRGESPTAIISDIISGMTRAERFTVIESRKDAIEYAIKTAKRGDVIVLAGKGHENYEITAKGRLPFDEKRIVLDAVEKYNCKNDTV